MIGSLDKKINLIYNKINMAIIEPRLLKGFRDYLPEKMIVRQRMIQIIKEAYERFGFLPLETPALEHADILLGKYGEEGEKLLYRFKDNGDRDVALRYDLTVPLARVVAQYPELSKPFKRYQVAPVWRAENPQKGRFREFYQCDADIVGTTSLAADAEIVAVISETLKALGVKDFVVSINNRKILDGVLKDLSLPAGKNLAVLRIIDRLEKAGQVEVEKDLVELVGDPGKFKNIQKFIMAKDSQAVAKVFPGAKEGLEELDLVYNYAANLGVAENNYKIDFSIARGLDYYTGTVYETRIDALPAIGSVFSGGRYDNLISQFIGRSIPAVGASIGLDRLFAALEELKVVEEVKSTAQAMIALLDDELVAEYQKMAAELRRAKINTLVFFDKIGLAKQLSYAAQQKIPFVVICGSKEKEADTVVLRDMAKEEQRELGWAEAKEFLKKQ